MRKSRMTALILVFVLVLVLALTACGQKEADQPGKGGAEADKVEQQGNDAEEKQIEQTRPIKILMAQAFEQPTMPYKEMPIPKEVMKRSGIEFEIEFVPVGDYDTKLNLYMAAGNPPDIFKKENFEFWKAQGAIIPLSDLIDQYGPNIKKMVLPEAWKYVKSEGEIYAIPKGQRPEPGNGGDVNGVLARWDWVEKLGFAEKAMSEDFDLDQYHDLIRAMTFDDPDGDGENNTYGLGDRIDWNFGHIMGAFGLPLHRHGSYGWVKRGDQVVATHMTEEYKQALKLLSEWYAEGVIDPEFIITKGKDHKEKYSKGIIGTSGHHMWYVAKKNAVNQSLVSSFPDAELKMIMPPKGPEGHRGLERRKPGGGGSALISSKAPDPEVAMMLLDYVMSEEGANLVQFGFEGEDYTYDQENNKVNLLYDGQIQSAKGTARIISVTDRRWVESEILEAISMTEKYTILNEFYGMVPAMGEYAELLKLVEETTIKVIVGQLPLEAVDDMQQRWLKNGGDKVTEQVNQEWKKLN